MDEPPYWLSNLDWSAFKAYIQTTRMNSAFILFIYSYVTIIFKEKKLSTCE